MTAETNIMNDVPLLPLPEPNGSYTNPYDGDDLENYARANVVHATAAKDAELVERSSTIEALRTELSQVREAYQRRTRDMYAREDSIMALRAEVERLTLEMERLQQQYDERTACMIVHRGSALACSDAVRAAYYEEHERAEQLAGALRLAEEHIDSLTPEWYSAGQRVLATIRSALHPTAAQENDDA